MPGCECEKAQQSEHSPGLVDGSEHVIYCLIDPDLVGADSGELKNKAFSKSVLKKTELSVVRKPHSSEQEIRDRVIEPQLASNPSRRFYGVYACITADIRAIRDVSPQDVCVADCGLPEFASHAHLGFSEEVAAQNRSVQEAVRMNLVDAFRQSGLIKDLSELFDDSTAS